MPVNFIYILQKYIPTVQEVQYLRKDMNDKMTSGEIAKKAGISQKAVRLYDQKGLLKPSSYSEENYRLG